MSETSSVYTGAATMSAQERALCEERRWEEAGRFVAEIARRVPDWFRLPPDVEQHFQQACVEQLRGVRAIIDHQIAQVNRLGRRSTGTKINVE